MITWEQIISDALKIGIPSIIAIVSIVFNLIGIFGKQKRDFLEQKRNRLVEKQEEAISSLLSYQIGLRDYLINGQNYLAGSIKTPEELNELIKAGIPRQQESEIKIKTLSIAYFPELLSDWDAFFEKKKNLSNKIIEMSSREIPPLSHEKYGIVEQMISQNTIDLENIIRKYGQSLQLTIKEQERGLHK